MYTEQHTLKANLMLLPHSSEWLESLSNASIHFLLMSHEAFYTISFHYATDAVDLTGGFFFLDDIVALCMCLFKNNFSFLSTNVFWDWTFSAIIIFSFIQM